MSTKEEQKQHLIDMMKGDEELGLYELGQEVGHSVQVEETLEEVAERIYPTKNTGSMFMPDRDELNNSYKQEAFIEGAKWQKDRMFSDEDMIDFSEWVSLNFPNQHNYLRNLQKRIQGLDVPAENLKGYYSTKELFEQFKKQ